VCVVVRPKKCAQLSEHVLAPLSFRSYVRFSSLPTYRPKLSETLKGISFVALVIAKAISAAGLAVFVWCFFELRPATSSVLSLVMFSYLLSFLLFFSPNSYR
jgi:preprotein translocase subunit SecF